MGSVNGVVVLFWFSSRGATTGCEKFGSPVICGIQMPDEEEDIAFETASTRSTEIGVCT